MAKDAIKEEIERTMQNLENQLKRQGFKDSDIDELKADLEVKIKKQSSLAEVIEVIRKAKEKVQNKNGKKIFSDESAFDTMTDGFKDYKPSSDLERQVSVEELEDLGSHEERPELEGSISANNKYFSQGAGGESSNISYLSNTEHSYASSGSERRIEVSEAVRHAQEKEKEMLEHQAYGRAKKEEAQKEAFDPSSVYR